MECSQLLLPVRRRGAPWPPLRILPRCHAPQGGLHLIVLPPSCGNVAAILELDENLERSFKVFEAAPQVGVFLGGLELGA